MTAGGKRAAPIKAMTKQAAPIKAMTKQTAPIAARGSTVFAACILGIAVAVLTGWALDVAALKSVLPGLTSMKPNTAAGLAACALGLALVGRPGGRARGILTLAALGVALLGAATLVEYVGHVTLGLDEALFADPATTSRPFNGRMSPATAIGFVASGAGLCLLGLGRTRRAVTAGHLLALVPASIGFLSLTGYAYGVERLYNFGPYVSVALHTGACLVLLAAGMILARREEGWGSGLTETPVAYAALLRIAALSLLVPFVTGLLVVLGIRAGFYQAQFSPSLFALAAAGALLVLAFRSAYILARAEGGLRRARDETDRMANELTRTRRRHEALIVELPQLVWTCRSDGWCEYLSRQWVDYTGIPEADQLGFEWIGRAVHPEDAERTRTHWMGAVAGEHPYDIEYRIRGADGAYRWFKVRGLQLPAEDGSDAGGTWFGTCTDIEDIVAARETLSASRETLEAKIRARTDALMAAEEQLRQSQKMEAVGQLTGGLAHDFNNLLTGITGSLELLQTRLSQGRLSELERYALAAQGAASRAAALTHRLLAFSRRQTLDPRPADANRLVAGMEELIRRTTGPAIALEVVTAGALWPVLVDPPQLENALLNLAINARDAMPEGGRLTIETANRWLDERSAKQRDLTPGQYVSICVSDTGTGMTPDVVARAFDPFFTTKPIGLGTGLGLSMIYGFVRQSGGQARIYSELGRGATICLYLPRHFEEAAGLAATPEPALPRARVGETVLVIDDEPTVCMLVTEVLQDLGYAAIEAGDGASGLRILQSDVRIDLLITDVGLPGGLNGRQVADAARTLRPGLKVLFMTGFAENAVLNHGHLDRDMHVLTKPFAMDAMARRIKDLLAPVE